MFGVNYKIKGNRMNDTTKLDRYEHIFQKILRQENLNTVQIAKYLGCTRRTIERDLKDVISVLFESPIECVDRVWVVPKSIIDFRSYSASNLVSICLLLKKTSDDNPELYSKTVNLFDILHEKISHSIYKQSSIEELFPSCKDEFYMVKNAIENTEEIKFSFFYDDNIKNVQPLKIVNLENYWYLFCFDLKANAFRKYHFKGVKNIELLNRKFDLKEHVYIDKLENAVNAFFNIEEENKIQLKITKEARKVLSRKKLNSTQKIYKDKLDDKYFMDIIVSDLREISPLIQQWIPHIEVISPLELKDLIKENLNNYQI